MPREGYKSLTLNKKMLLTIKRIREEIKSSMAVPIELEDSKVVEAALDFFLKTLEKGKGEREGPSSGEDRSEGHGYENRESLLALLLQKTRSINGLDTLLESGSLEKMADSYLNSLKRKPGAPPQDNERKPPKEQ